MDSGPRHVKNFLVEDPRVGNQALFCKECFREMAHEVFGDKFLEHLAMPFEKEEFLIDAGQLIATWRMGHPYISLRVVSVALGGLRRADYPYTVFTKNSVVVGNLERLTNALEVAFREYIANTHRHECGLMRDLIFMYNTLLRLGSSGLGENILCKTLDFEKYVAPFDFDFQAVLDEEKQRGLRLCNSGRTTAPPPATHHSRGFGS